MLALGKGSPTTGVLSLLKQWKTRKPKPSTCWFWKQVGWVFIASLWSNSAAESFRCTLPIFVSKQRKISPLFMCLQHFRHVFSLGKWTCFMLQVDNWFKVPDIWYNDMQNECWFLNPQLWKLHFLRYQKQHRCSATDGELDHPSLSLWDAQTSLRGICVGHWQRWDRWMFGGTCLAHTVCDSRQLSWRLSGSTRRSPASPVLLDLCCVGSTRVSHVRGEGCYLKIKVYGPWLQIRNSRSSF